MGFLNFRKKRGESLDDIDLDVPPEPPKIRGMNDVSMEEPIDEELMPLKRGVKPKRARISKKEELPELPPLPEMEEDLPLPEEGKMELPPLPGEEQMQAMPKLPPLEQEEKTKKGLFSFFKKKKMKEVPKMEEEFPELPSLPEGEAEFPEIPEMGETPSLPDMEEISAPRIPIRPEPEMPISRSIPENVPEPAKPLPKVKAPEKQVVKTKFITINDFRQVQEVIDDSKNNLKGIEDAFSRLEEIKLEKDRVYNEWQSSLHDIQRKILFVDKTLFEEGD